MIPSPVLVFHSDEYFFCFQLQEDGPLAQGVEMMWLAFEPTQHMLLFCSMQRQPNLISYACTSYNINLVDQQNPNLT